jgi:hypothetical protein
MSEELQAEIARLKSDNAKLTTDLASLGDELKDVRHEARDRRHEAKGLAQQLAELTTDRDRFKAAAEADPEDLRKQVADHQGTIRGLKHERAFERVARTLKVSDPVKYADLLTVARYAPEGDEPDESRIAATFGEALKGRPWLVDAEPKQPEPGGSTTAPGGAGATDAARPAVPGPGADRGQSVSSPQGQPANRIAGRL